MAKKIRMWVIGILAMAGLVLLMGEPIEEETWFEVFFATKLGGLRSVGCNGSALETLGGKGLAPRR